MVELIAHRFRIALGCEGVALQGGLQAETIAQRGNDGVGLDAGGSRTGGRRPVAGVPDVVVAAVDSQDTAGPGIDRGDGGVQSRRPVVTGIVAGDPLVPLPGVNGRLLHLGVQGGGDLETAASDLGLGEPLGDEFVLDELEEVSLGSLPTVVDGHVGEIGQCVRGSVVIVLADPAHLEHAVQDVAVASEQTLPCRRSIAGIEEGGIVEHGGEHRGLPQVEILGIDVEVCLGRRLDAIGAAPEVDGVEVAGEDVLLGHLAAHLVGQDEFLELALHGAFLGQVEHLDVLLGDRRSALDIATPEHAERSSRHTFHRDPGVAPEGAILGRDDCVPEVLGHLVVGDRLTILHRETTDLRCRVVGVDERRVRREPLVGVGQLGAMVEHRPGRDDGHDHDENEDEQSPQHSS